MTYLIFVTYCFSLTVNESTISEFNKLLVLLGTAYFYFFTCGKKVLKLVVSKSPPPPKPREGVINDHGLPLANP